MASSPYLGSIYLFAGNFAPRGFQMCQGQLLNISSNAALFSILGTTFGGNGVSTFALPDLQGRSAVGLGNGAGLGQNVLGQKAGTQNVTLTTANIPNLGAHTHTINVSTAPAAQTAAQNNFLAVTTDGSGNSSPTNYNTTATAGTTMAATSIAPAITGGSGLPVSIQDPYLVLTYIIAITGIFPSRS